MRRGDEETRRRGDEETRRRGDAGKTEIMIRGGKLVMGNIRSYKELRVYQASMDAAMEIFVITKRFPPEEKYSMVDQIRRSSRSVCTNIAEAWRKRRYPAHFVSKLTDSSGEADETRVWIEFAYRCNYITEVDASELDAKYDGILGQLVRMMDKPEQWTIH